MLISIIIPTLHQGGYYEKIIKNLENVIPKDITYEIITIENKLVNEARNLGVEQSKGDYILIINDDIVIPKGVIEGMIEVLKEKKIACPYYTRADDTFVFNNNGENLVGFCFMIKRKDIYTCFPIPEQLKLRYGDNYIYEKLDRNLGYYPVPIHHRESKTLMSDEKFEECKLICKEDKKYWLSIRNTFNL